MYAADMSVNSSSTSNLFLGERCTNIRVSLYMYDSIAALRILLLLPLSTFVLYLGHQRWRQHRSSKAATHSDIFTYHVASMELICVLGTSCLVWGQYAQDLASLLVGMYISMICSSGEIFFHILTCVERYLAVVHPITYMGLRNARGVRIRNICIGCVWSLCFGLPGIALLFLYSYINIIILCLLVLSTTVLSFCSLSVLSVLIRPSPGEGSREKQRIDQSRQRASYTITVISVAVWLWFVGLIVSSAVDMSPQLSESVRCMVMTSLGWLNLPSSLVSPLLYLHRAGKLSWCCLNSE